MASNTTGGNGGATLRGAGILEDLAADGPVRVGPDERLWKLYVFRPASGRASKLEHRIYSKLKANGQLALVTFAVHYPAGSAPARSGIAVVPELTDDALDHIIDTIRQQTQTAPDEYEEIDLTHLPTLPEQIEYLRQL